MVEFSEKPTCQSLNTSCTLLSFDTCQGLAYHDWQSNLWFIAEVQNHRTDRRKGRDAPGFYENQSESRAPIA
jgi:hypothetical protein